MPEVIVIGSGVIGLTTAIVLREAGYDARILTREEPLATTSVAAGAMWSGSELRGRARSWAAATHERLTRQIDIPGSGVRLQRMREVYAQPVPDPWYRALLPFFQRLSKHELRPGLVDGCLMDLPLVAPPVYLPFLLEQFLAAGGKLEIRSLESLDEVADEARLLVNCSGVGARALAKDETVYPIRGQTLLLGARDIRVGYMDHSAVDHIFPRVDGTLVGGVKAIGDWNRTLDPAVSADIMARVTRVEKRLAGAPVLREFVGLRPGRHEPRLEAETLADGTKVIHNYGHAAVGYTLSWGCAQEVAALADSLLA